MGHATSMCRRLGNVSWENGLMDRVISIMDFIEKKVSCENELMDRTNSIYHGKRD